MQILSWHEGGSGTVRCVDGHVHLRGVKHRSRLEEVLTRISNDSPKMPPTVAFVKERLAAAGCSSREINRHECFGDARKDWERRIERAPARAPDPDPGALQIGAPAETDPNDDLTDEELLELAEAAGVDGAEAMTREQLLDALKSDRRAENPEEEVKAGL